MYSFAVPVFDIVKSKIIDIFKTLLCLYNLF